MALATELRDAIADALAPMKDRLPGGIKVTRDERQQFTSALPMIRVYRSGSSIELDNLEQWAHDMEVVVTYIDEIDEAVDVRVDDRLEEIQQLVTRDQALGELTDLVEPTEIEIEDVDSDSPITAASLTFTIQYTEGV